MSKSNKKPGIKGMCLECGHRGIYAFSVKCHAFSITGRTIFSRKRDDVDDTICETINKSAYFLRRAAGHYWMNKHLPEGIDYARELTEPFVLAARYARTFDAMKDVENPSWCPLRSADV